MVAPVMPEAVDTHSGALRKQQVVNITVTAVF